MDRQGSRMFQPKPLALNIINMEPVVQLEQPCFSIGIKTKTKKKSKSKSKKYAPVLNLLQPDILNIYRGHRWKIPEGIQVSNSVKSKFSMLATLQNFKEVREKITENIRSMKFNFYYSTETPWKAPQSVISHITSYYAKQENEWNKVRAIYFRIFKLRKLVLPLVFKWQVRKCLTNCKNIEDPVTLEVPKNPVIIIDFIKRMSFVYDANTLKKTIENRLLLSDYMFPEPRAPVNLLTNEPFTLGQLISVVDQCKKHGYVSWLMDAYKGLNADIQLFSFHNKQKLKVEAIKTFFKRDPIYLREVVIDYFNLEADNYDLPILQKHRFINAYDTNPDGLIVQKWIGLTREYYIAKELNEPKLLMGVSDKIEDILNVIYKQFLYTFEK